MNEIWANRLTAGTKVWANVPDSRKGAVKKVLAGRVSGGILTSDQYKVITGEVYSALKASFIEQE